MTSLFPHLAKIDVEVITVLVFLLISFASWLKDRFSRSGKDEESELSAEQEALRETIWKRQMGEETAPMPWEDATEQPPPPPRTPTRDQLPPPIPQRRTEPTASTPSRSPVVIRETAITPPPVPRPSAFEAAMQAPRPNISARQNALAESFERITRSGTRRSARNRAVIAMLRRPESARQAILLQEIIGPPVALRNEPTASR